MIGKRLGRYEVIAKLGEGGMGSVWRARDTLLERDVALKTLTEDNAELRTVRTRFLREAKSASHLHHPGIATVYDAGEADGLLYITFQLVEGQTLRERLAEGPVPVDEALRIATEAAQALQYAHENGVLHRDITSRNLMLDQSGRVVIVDFGLALDLERTRLTGHPAQMGTAGYMAPEIVRGEDADVQTDLYGLGAVLYELLVGRIPFRGSRLEQVLYATVNQDPEAPSVTRPEVSSDLDSLVLSLLAKDRAQRPGSAVEVAILLRGMQEDTSTGVDITVQLPNSRRPADSKASKIAISRRGFVIGALVAGALSPVAIIALRSLLRSRGIGAAPRLLAVLPLRNLTPEDTGQTDWLAEAVSSNLVDRLTNRERLQMTPWVTSFRFDPMNMGLAEIASELGVDVLLTGNLRLIADELNVSLALVEQTGESQFWSQEFRGPYSGLFELQREMAVGVAAALLGEEVGDPGATESDPAQNVRAYRLYTEGARAIRLGTRKGSDEAFRFFEQALKLDSEMADAHTGLGAVYSERYYMAREGGNHNLVVAQEHFERALVLDPENAGALQGLLSLDWMRGRIVQVLERAEDARWTHGEDVDDLATRGRAYLLGGMSDRAVVLFRRLLERDPANQGALWFLTIAQSWAGRYEESIESSQTYLRRFGSDPEIRMWRAVTYSMLGNYPRAVPEAGLAIREWGDENKAYGGIWCGVVLRAGGDLEGAEQIWREGVQWGEERLKAYPENVRLAGVVAGLHYLLGDRDAGDRTREVHGGSDGAEEQIAAGELILALGYLSPADAIEALRALLPSQGWPEPMDQFLALFAGPGFAEDPAYRAFLEEAEQVQLELRRRISF